MWISIQYQTTQKTAIFTDSIGALQSKISYTFTSRATNWWKTFSFTLKNAHWSLEWIPAHFGIAGNERAHLLAKSGNKTTSTPFHLHVKVSQNPAPQQSNIQMEKSHWRLQTLYQLSQPHGETREYNPSTRPVNPVTRQLLITIIFRLQTGHCIL